MATPDLEVIKDIPGYKVILKAVLKSQIQQLVEQLAQTTEEESVILTASVSDGTLSHLGSDSGKNFLEDHEDIKSQFLGFCLKRHHRRKQEVEREKAQQEQERQQREAMLQMPTNFAPGPYGLQAPPRLQQRARFPRQQFRMPSPRHQPYPINRPYRAGTQPPPPRLESVQQQVIKIEPDDDNGVDGANDKNSDNAGTPTAADDDTSSPQSATADSPAAKIKQAEGEDADVKSETTNPSEGSDKFGETQPPGGLSLDSDLSTLIDQESSQSATATSSSAALDQTVNVKVENISESEMELEITGVEPGHVQTPEMAGWSPNVSGADLSYDPTGGASGSQADMMGGEQGYNLQFPNLMSGTSQPSTITDFPRTFFCHCGKAFLNKSHFTTHQKIHTGVKPFKCEICGKSFLLKHHLKNHQVVHVKVLSN